MNSGRGSHMFLDRYLLRSKHALYSSQISYLCFGFRLILEIGIWAKIYIGIL